MELKINNSLKEKFDSISIPSGLGIINGEGLSLIGDNYDLSKADNGVSTTIWPTIVNLCDKESRIGARLEECVYANGTNGSYWYVRNYNTDGSLIAQKGISMNMNKSGDLTYTIADAGNFRTALDVAPKGNYGFYKWLGSIQLTSATSPISQEISITTKGRPVYIAITGDNNPMEDSCWFEIRLYRNGTLLSSQIVESHGSSWNIPFAMVYLDEVGAGTYTYKAEFGLGAGSSNLNESGSRQGPNFTVYEI